MIKSNKINQLKYSLDHIGWEIGLKLSTIGFNKLGSLFYHLCRFSFHFSHNPFEVVAAIHNYTTDKKLMSYEFIFDNRNQFDTFMFFYFKTLTNQEEIKVEIVFNNEETRQIENYYDISCKDGRREFSKTSSMVIVCDDHDFLQSKLTEALSKKHIWKTI